MIDSEHCRLSATRCGASSHLCIHGRENVGNKRMQSSPTPSAAISNNPERDPKEFERPSWWRFNPSAPVLTADLDHDQASHEARYKFARKESLHGSFQSSG
jgi:hypothetical protein